MSRTFDTDRPGPRASRIREMLRVDHAGEYGAVQIYRGQRAVFDALPSKTELSALLKHMEDGEQHHLSTFDRLLPEYGARPTVLSPLWNLAGFALGAGTALMGEKAAMACTAAVEDVIEKHYAEQAEALDGVDDALAETVRQFRDEEIEHKETAEAEGARETPGYDVLRAVIQAGCRAAIKVSEKL
ncbi:MAG: demethoxyubiquinone hydroxylase family protein [Pseudomonadota bacterium]